MSCLSGGASCGASCRNSTQKQCQLSSDDGSSVKSTHSPHKSVWWYKCVIQVYVTWPVYAISFEK